MNDFISKREIVPVYGEQALLIEMAEKVDRIAMQRAQASAPAGTINPLITYESEAEIAVIGKKIELERQYQVSLGFELPPVLVPADTPPLSQPPSIDNSIKIYRKAPTDMELAELFLKRVIVRRIGDRIYLFDGRIYKLLNDNKFHTLIYDTLRQELSINGSSKQIKNVAAAILAEPSIEVRPEEMNVAGICLRNGIFDLTTCRLYEHSPGHFFTWMLDVDWLGDQPCPNCDQFFMYAAGGDQILIRRFWEALAYALFPDYNAKRFIILMGLGDSGKSVYGAVVESFFEKDFVGSVDIFKFGDRFSVESLAHKRVNISMDLNDTALNEQATAIIKQITGRDLVQVEAKYKAPYATRIDCKLIFGTNHSLRTNSKDVAFLRRVLYLPFNYQVPPHKQNPNLRQLLRAERSGIFYKALKAYRGLVAKGYFFSGDDVYDFTKAYQVGEQSADLMTDLEQFAATRCIEQRDGFVPTDVLFECYHSYCQSLNHEYIRNKQVFSTKFNAIMQCNPNIQNKKKRVNGISCNGYEGLSLI